MDKGFLQTGNLMAFNKKGHKISISPRDDEGMMIAQKLISADFNGWIGIECGLAAFDYKNIIMRW